MANAGYGAAYRQVNRIFDGGTVAGLTEAQLLERFVTRRDEIAFEALVARHGPMVFGVCRRILRDPSDAEDAFQATFLVLVRQARSIRGRDTLGGWLHRVAYRVAIRASAGRRKPECVELDSLAAPELADGDLIALIHEELDRLPAKYRAPIVLCDLENHTHEQAAEALRWPLGTVKGRLSRARNLLKDRLTRRGVGVPAVAIGLALGRDAKASLSPVLLNSTVKAAMSYAAGQGLVAGVASAVAVGLAQGVIRTMFWHSIKLTTAALVAFSLVGVAGVGTFGQVPGGEHNGAAVVEPKQLDPLPIPTDLPVPADAALLKRDPDADLRPTAKALLGTWNVVEKIDGDIDEIGLPFKDKVVITRDRIQLGKPGEADLTYELRLLEHPKLIRWAPTFGPYAGKTSGAAFGIDGDRLTIVYVGLDHQDVTPGSLENNGPGGDLFTVHLQREGSKSATTEKPPVASPEADITKLQGAWVLREQTYRVRGVDYKINKPTDPPGMFGAIGAGFVIDGYSIRDNQSTNNEPPVVAKIIGYDGGTTPKQIDIEPADKSIQFNRGIPLGKAIYKLDGDRFLIRYDPAHPNRRPEQRSSLVGETRVDSVFERATPPVAAVTHPDGDIRGRWKVVSSVDGGVPELLPPGLHDVVFSDNGYGRIDDKGLAFKSEYRVDTIVKPWRIKATDVSTGQLIHAGIYKIDGDRLTLCLMRSNGTYPTEFESRPGSQRLLLTLDWVGPMTEDLKAQMQRSREDRLEQARKLSAAAANPDVLPQLDLPDERPIHAPKDLDEKRAELQMEQEILSKEFSRLKEAIFSIAQEIKQYESRIRASNNPDVKDSHLAEEGRKQIELGLAGLRKQHETKKKLYVEKFRDLSRLKKEMDALGGGGPDLPITDQAPLALPTATDPSGRLADFDRQIRLLQQKRDAYLMSLPDDERQTLLKQLAP